MSESEIESNTDFDLPDLVQIVRTRWRTIAGGAAIFLAVAVIGSMVRSPVYEATAFLEVADESEIATIQDELKFPSLYQQIEEDGGAAGALANRVRVRASRGSRIIGVTVKHSEPSIAVEEANAIVEAFIAAGMRDASSGNPEEIRKQLKPIRALPEAESVDSPEVLAATWQTQKAELEQLMKTYAEDHPVAAGARERLEKLEQRMRDQFSKIREELELPAAEAGDFKAQVEQMLVEVGAARKSGENLEAALRRLEDEALRTNERFSFAERASVPLDPAGIPSSLIWLGALALGAFAGFLVALCRRG